LDFTTLLPPIASPPFFYYCNPDKSARSRGSQVAQETRQRTQGQNKQWQSAEIH